MEFGFLVKAAFALSMVYFVIGGAWYRRSTSYTHKLHEGGLKQRVFAAFMPLACINILYAGWAWGIEYGLVTETQAITLSQRGHDLGLTLAVVFCFGMVGFRIGILVAELMPDTPKD